MNANVRRLVLDISPPWAAALLLLYLATGLFDWAVVDGSTRPGSWIGAIMAYFAPLMLSSTKFAVWRVLPVPLRDRTRAQWWLGIGGPMLLMTGTMAIAALIAWATGGLRASWTHALAYLGGELAIGAVAACIMLGDLALRRRSGWRLAMLVVLPAYIAVIGGSLWAPPPEGDADFVLIGAGALSLAAAGALYLLTGRVTQEALGAAPPRTRPPEAEAVLTIRAERLRLVGWASLAPHVLTLFGVAVIGVLAADWLLDGVMRGRNLPPDHVGTAVIAAIVTGAPALMAPSIVRVLRSLPLGPAGLTLTLQGLTAVFTLAVFLIVQLLSWSLDREGPTSLAPMILAAVPINASRLPLMFRLGPRLGAYLNMLPFIVLPVLAVIVSPTATLVAIDLALTAAIWAWTWWELACGRAAYRAWTAGMVRWRGGFN